jgi:hypothetical protein
VSDLTLWAPLAVYLLMVTVLLSSVVNTRRLLAELAFWRNSAGEWETQWRKMRENYDEMAKAFESMSAVNSRNEATAQKLIDHINALRG